MRVYVARQPIYNADRTVFGYELLYRDSDENVYRADIDGSMATRAVLSDAVVTFGLDNLTHGKYAFINFTRSLLLTQLPFLLDPKDFVIEILEDTVIDDTLLERIAELHNKQYLLAMDDFAGDGDTDEIGIVDILKVDFRMTTPQERAQIARRYRNKRLLAEKVETAEEFEAARVCGYTLFQGYYFSRPTLLSKNMMRIAATTYSRIFREVTGLSPDFGNLARIIQLDVNLMYLFLHRVNTLQYYRGNRVTSVRDALVRMGLGEIKRWTLLVLLRDSVGSGQDEVVRTALVRGVFAEKLAGELRLGSDAAADAYLMGMFSIIDHVQEEIDAWRELCVSQAVRDAFAGASTPLGDLLRFILAYEDARWDELSPFLKDLCLDRGRVATLYLESLQYADGAFEDTSPASIPAQRKTDGR